MNLDNIYDPYAQYEGNTIHETAIIYPNVIMGKGNKIGPYCVIGSDGEIRGVNDFQGRVIIGDNNVISEMVTIQRPNDFGKSTKIGSNNIIMAHSHIGHDAELGDNIELSTGSIIGGYAKIGDNSKI
jgi:UDP-N-acetylglucosamine acyltransferase